MVWCSFTVPLGERTFAEHMDRIGQTSEAQELMDGTRSTLSPALEEATQRMLGEHIEAPTSDGPDFESMPDEPVLWGGSSPPPELPGSRWVDGLAERWSGTAEGEGASDLPVSAGPPRAPSLRAEREATSARTLAESEPSTPERLKLPGREG